MITRKRFENQNKKQTKNKTTTAAAAAAAAEEEEEEEEEEIKEQKKRWAVWSQAGYFEVCKPYLTPVSFESVGL